MNIQQTQKVTHLVTRIYQRTLMYFRRNKSLMTLKEERKYRFGSVSIASSRFVMKLPSVKNAQALRNLKEIST